MEWGGEELSLALGVQYYQERTRPCYDRSWTWLKCGAGESYLLIVL